MQTSAMLVALLGRSTSMSERYHYSLIFVLFFSINTSFFMFCLSLHFMGVKTVVQRGIAMEGATDALIQLIKDHDRWVDPPAQD